mgnify:CR=1 FL=1
MFMVIIFEVYMENLYVVKTDMKIIDILRKCCFVVDKRIYKIRF